MNAQKDQVGCIAMHGRYTVAEGFEGGTGRYFQVLDYGTSADRPKEIYRTESVNLRGLDAPTRFHEESKIHNEVHEWLNQHFPDWRDPLAYWDWVCLAKNLLRANSLSHTY